MSYLHLYDSFCCFDAFEVLLQATQYTEEYYKETAFYNKLLKER